MIIPILITISGFILMNNSPSTEQKNIAAVKPECVVLIHGLGRSPWAMRKLDKHFRNEGYDVANLGYPSTRKGIEKIASEVYDKEIQPRIKKYHQIHIVTHSLGGIVLREILAHHDLPNLGRTVMLCPPNRGSSLAESLRRHAIFRMLLGPALTDLGTHEKCFSKKLGSFPGELGVITGNVSWNPLFSRMIPGPDDGKVSLREAWLDGQKDYLVLPYGHTFIMNKDEVLNQTQQFIEHGQFNSMSKAGWRPERAEVFGQSDSHSSDVVKIHREFQEINQHQ